MVMFVGIDDDDDDPWLDDYLFVDVDNLNVSFDPET
jgi:hypothetical protein